MTSNSTGTRIAEWLEHAWLSRYLDRELSAEEVAWFEAYVLDKPDLLERIEADTELRDALAATASSESTAERAERAPHDAVAELPASPQHRRISGTRRAAPRYPFAVAASLLLGLAGGWIANRALLGGSAPGTLANPEHIRYDAQRGATTAPRVVHSDSRSPYRLIEVAVPPQAVDVRLHVQGAPDVSLAPPVDGFVEFLAERNVRVLGLSYTVDGTVHELALEDRAQR